MHVSFKTILFILALTKCIIAVESVPCKTMLGCQCDENETIIKCENVIGLSIITGIKPNVVSLTVKNSYLGPTLNTSFSSYIMEVEQIDLSHDRIHTVTAHVFKYLRNLRKLTLRNNFLRILTPEVFEHLTALEDLDLSYNRFQSLPDRPFYSLVSLHMLDISYNNLTSLKLGLRFQVMENMQVLNFSGNNFQTISEDAFEMTPSWRENVPKTINLSNCGVQYIESGAFRNPKGLENLILKGNYVISLVNLTGFFNSTDSPRLRMIDLSNTGLTEVSELFISLRRRNIQDLILSHNNITDLTSDLDENLAGTLRKFDVSNNKLSSLSPSVTKLRNLKYLDLSNNNIENVDSNFDTGLAHLKYLNLANNKIPSGQFSLQNFVHLEDLNLSFNNLDSFIMPKTLNKLRAANLAGNGIQSLTSLEGLTNLAIFNFQYNELTELPKFLFVDSPKINSVNFSGNEIEKLDDSTFDPHSPQNIDLSYNQLTKLKFPGWQNVKTINLRGNKLENINGESFYALFQLTSLDLSENNLIFIEDNTFLYLTNVTTLQLQHNQLLGISNWGKIFKALILLQSVDLSYNNLTKFESSIFTMSKSLRKVSVAQNNIHYINPSGFKGMVKLEEVNFSGNKFLCNCDLVAFRDWLKTSGVKIVHEERGNYTCYIPLDKKGKDVRYFELDKFECDFMFLYIVVYSTIGGILVIVIIITAFVCHYHLKWHRQLNNSPPPSIEFESIERVPFIPDDTILRHSKNKMGHKKMKKTSDKKQTKKKKPKEHSEMLLINGKGKHAQNGKIANGRAGKIIQNKTKSKSKTNTKKKQRSLDKIYRQKNEHELIIPKPRRRAQSNLEMNPYVQQYLWQEYKKQQKNLINKRLNRESFRNVDIIRPSRSSPDFKYGFTNTLPRSHSGYDHKLNEYYPEMGTWHGQHNRSNTHLSHGDLNELDYTDNKRKIPVSGYNTISGVPSHRPHVHYI